MPYHEMMVKPMREEVTRLGIKELRTVADVDAALGSSEGTAMVFVNSVCGCAAGGARPALAMAVSHGVKPQQLYTVFAGQDLDATARARSYFADYQPSSPSVAFLRDGEVVHFIHRHMIEGRPPQVIAEEIIKGFDKVAAEGARAE
ncbi:MAG: BrxA/BrxB family bacilliredoxin [Gemmatimonadales bacterium]|nr:BrxA/BrxB family bacilliredoxin [Gemmatimonadales bacterium]